MVKVEEEEVVGGLGRSFSAWLLAACRSLHVKLSHTLTVGLLFARPNAGREKKYRLV